MVFFALLVAYMGFVFFLLRTGRMEKWGLSLMLGFVIMVRTQRGKRLIEAIAKPKRFWNAFGDLGTGVTLLGMAAFSVFFFWSVWFVLQPSSRVEPFGASELLVIPGVNPFVPLWYGIIALIVTLVVHEGGHGILARANGMRLKSLGLLFAIAPIGAFVEPDEEDMRQSSRRARLRVFAAGPMTNLAVAAITLAIFAGMVGALEPHEGGAILVAPGGAAEQAGMMGAEVITGMDGQSVATAAEVRAILLTHAPGDTIDVVTRQGEFSATLRSAWDGYSSAAQQEILASNATLAEELQNAPRLGIQLVEATDLQDTLGAPFSRAESFLWVVSLPISEVRGTPYLGSHMEEWYTTPFDADVFWITARIVFWIFWIDLMVGLTNILPMLPLDGGHIFRDAVGGVVARLRPNMPADRQEHIVGRTAVVVSFLILAAFLLQILGPRLVGLWS